MSTDQPSPAPSAPASSIVVERPWAWSWAASSMTVLVDDEPSGTVESGKSVTIPVAPGQHSVVVCPNKIARSLYGSLEDSHPFAVDLAPGETARIVVRFGMMGKPSLALSEAPGQAVPGEGASSAGEPAPPVSPQTATAPTAVSTTGAVPQPGTVRYTVVEAAREETSLGDEPRTIDNSQSSSPTSRVVRLTREWSRTYTVEVERATTLSGSLDLAIHVLDLKGGAERTLTTTYSASGEQQETFEEEVTINVAAHTRSVVVFSWKEIRQHGVVRAEAPGYSVEIPYEVVVGITFDQRQVDG